MGYLLNLAKRAPREPSAVEAEIRALLALQMPETDPDFSEALALALANPAVHLEGLRASTPAPEWAMRGRND